MWCSQCQQDVPAVARTSDGPLICTCCTREIKLGNLSGISDTGIALDSFQSEQVSAEHLSRPIDHIAEEISRENLRRIARQLRSPYREELGIGSPSTTQGNWQCLQMPSDPAAAPQLRQIAKMARHDEATSESPSSWLLSCLLALGVAGFTIGVALLTYSVAFDFYEIWHWGMTTTIAAEGLLIVGLTWMAIRLWHNSRRLNSELQGVDEQLTEIHEMAGILSAGKLSASQYFYHHFSQVASPHMLVANLRGQVDQLAERIYS